MDTQEILDRALQAVATASELRGLDDVRVAFLGKKGELTGLLKGRREEWGEPPLPKHR